jgi:hypothetical protein
LTDPPGASAPGVFVPGRGYNRPRA